MTVGELGTMLFGRNLMLMYIENIRGMEGNRKSEGYNMDGFLIPGKFTASNKQNV